jgi:hypothetical protein
VALVPAGQAAARRNMLATDTGVNLDRSDSGRPRASQRKSQGRVSRASSGAKAGVSRTRSVAPTLAGEGMGYNKTSNATGVLEAEFFACMVLLAFTIFTDPKASSDYASVMLAAMKRGTMLIILFFVLSLVSAAGPNAGKAAKAFGALVLVGLILAQAETGLFTMLDGLFKSDWTSAGSTSGNNQSPGPSSGNAAAGTQTPVNVNTSGIGNTGSNGTVGSDINNVNVGGLTLHNIESGAGSVLSQLPGAVVGALAPETRIPGIASAVKKALGWLGIG